MTLTLPAPTDTTFLDQRLAELGVNEKDNIFTRVWASRHDEKKDDGVIVTKEVNEKRDYKIFDSDEEGNIVIRYFNQHGQPYRWKKEDTKLTRDFVRKRLKVPKGSMKYSQESGSELYPFFTPGIIKKFKAKQEIETLYLVEGEFKAFKASMNGLDFVGLPGIHGFYNGDVKGKLHDDIQDLIIACKVHKIVLLFDADFLGINWAQDKDLVTRPNNFYSSIKAFRESLQVLLDAEDVNLELVYYMHIKSKYMNEAKGIDDLFCKYSSVPLEIIEDLNSLNHARKYFDGFSILDQQKDVHTRAFHYLGLINEQEFYKTYRDFIGAREFKFRRRRYIYNDEKKEVVFVRHEDADKFMRIGPDWVKLVTKLNKFGEKEEEVVAWKISEITRDYKKFPDFLEQVQKYDDFCNEPNWNGSYQRVINNCYNLCEPLKWQPKEGSIASTIAYLKHVFQGKGNIVLGENGLFEKEEAFTGDPFTVILDWLTILIKNPKHMLPVPVLVSPENETGKTTFLKWLQMIFGTNACILGNAQFQMKFNGHYITKFIIGIDESFLEVDKKAEKERLKQLVTADSVYLENKGMNVRKMMFYGKLILVSNDADRIMKIEEGETRWFVVRVPKIPRIKLSGQELVSRGFKTLKQLNGKPIDPNQEYDVPNIDPDLEFKMKKECPAFLHFIYNREVFHPRASRLWFDPEWIITDQYKTIVETTKNRIDRVFESWIREQFLSFNLPVLRYTTTFLVSVFNDSKNSKYKIDELELKTYLSSKGLKPEAKSIYHKSPKGFRESVFMDGNEPEDKSPSIMWWSGTGRPYTFKAEDWLNEQDQITLGINQNQKSDEELPF